MTLHQKLYRLAAALAIALAAGLLSTAHAAASTGAGWVRLAHLSPNTPPVDVYLYSFGDPTARLVLHHVAYGTVSPYEQVPAGDYTVSMRAAGAAPTARPVLSTGFWVSHGDAYTVAGMGPASGLRLQVLKNTLAVPPQHAMVRVIEASLRQHSVRVTFGRRVIAPQLQFGRATTYREVAAGTRVVRVTGGSEHASLDVKLAADTIHTLVVLDGPGHLRITDLADAAGSGIRPTGGADTGLGGTAPRPAPSPLPWLAVISAGALLAVAGAWRYRQIRSPRIRVS
jgi:uncharacterized protein DUF4397